MLRALSFSRCGGVPPHARAALSLVADHSGVLWRVFVPCRAMGSLSQGVTAWRKANARRVALLALPLPVRAHVVPLLAPKPLRVSGPGLPRAPRRAFNTSSGISPVPVAAKGTVALDAKPHRPPPLVVVYSRVLWRVLVAVGAMGLLGVAHAAAATRLRVAILRVVLRRAQKQMRGIYARRIVTGVANQDAVGDRPVVQFPRNAVRLHAPPSNTEVPVLPLMMTARRPFPAVAGLAYLRPKPFRNRSAHSVNLTDSPMRIKAERLVAT